MDPRTRIPPPWAEFIGSLGREGAPLAGSGTLQGSPDARAARKSLALPGLHLWLQRPEPSGGVARWRPASRYDWSSGPSFPSARPVTIKASPGPAQDGFGPGCRVLHVPLTAVRREGPIEVGGGVRRVPGRPRAGGSEENLPGGFCGLCGLGKGLRLGLSFPVFPLRPLKKIPKNPISGAESNFQTLSFSNS